MRLFSKSLLLAASVLLLPAAPTMAQDSPARKELKREDLTGAPGMEVINSISELKPGDFLALHFHHGIESGVVLQGGTVEIPGKGQMALPTGAPIMNLRNVTSLRTAGFIYPLYVFSASAPGLQMYSTRCHPGDNSSRETAIQLPSANTAATINAPTASELTRASLGS